jgi:hypothetical protein
MMNVNTLQSTWNTRKSELNFESAANELFAVLTSSNGILPRVPAIREEMDRKCRTSTLASDLRVPIWTYNQRKFLLSAKEERAKFGEGYNAWRAQREKYLVSAGYHNAINGVPLWKIFFKTDLLDRLTVALFGTTNFRLYVQRTNSIHLSDIDVDVNTYTIFLQFYPNGLSTPPSSPRMTAVPPPLPKRRPMERFVYDDETGLSREPANGAMSYWSAD